jgi:alpha-tubulin suppressor-like RCC1 family protein
MVDVDGGLYHTVALAEDGTVWTWGWNAYGQLGSGSTVDSSLPVRIAILDDVRHVAAGMHYSLAVKGDGTVWAWGRNDYGQLGGYSSSQSDTPVHVRGLEDCVRVAAGGHHAAAVTGNGSVWAWGWDFVGRVERALPRRLSGMRGIEQVKAGTHLTVVLKP